MHNVCVPSNSMLDVAHYCLSPIHPHVAELAEVKRLYQGKVFQMSKLKQKLEESQTSLDKVCSFPSCPVLRMSSFVEQVGISELIY